jgi:fructose-1,6-bisphosphatase
VEELLAGKGGPPRRLRFMCGANPMAFIVERAGGAVITGDGRIPAA